MRVHDDNTILVVGADLANLAHLHKGSSIADSTLTLHDIPPKHGPGMPPGQNLIYVASDG